MKSWLLRLPLAGPGRSGRGCCSFSGFTFAFGTLQYRAKATYFF